MSRDYRDVTKTRSRRFSNSLGLKSVFVGRAPVFHSIYILWTVDLTVEIKLRFQISLSPVGKHALSIRQEVEISTKKWNSAADS